MKIGPLFKWFGSKWSGAKHFPPPMHDIIVEPYAGSAGYSLNYCDKNVILWENDINLKLLWSWLIYDATESLIREIPVGLPVGKDIRDLHLSAGQWLLLKHWQRTNNVGGCWTISPWGHLPGQWTENTRARVAEEVSAIKHWKFSGDIWAYQDIPATWYIDPPYKFNYRYSKDLPDFNYGALVSRVKNISRRSLVIVSEALGPNGEVPKYLPFKPSHSQVTSRRKASQSHHSKELIYVRKPKPEKVRASDATVRVAK